MKWTGAQAEELRKDMHSAIGNLFEPFGADEDAWYRGPAGKWTAGQHVEHVGHMLAITAAPFGKHAKLLRKGSLGKRPWRDPLQAWFVGLATRDPFPRGGRAPKAGRPSAEPDRNMVRVSLIRGMGRHDLLVMQFSPEALDHLWIWNPFISLPWHYTLPEMLRVHAVHARHHGRLIREAIG